MRAMLHLADLLASIPLPSLEEEAVPLSPAEQGPSPAMQGCGPDDPSLMHDLGGDLPAGHVHVWGGPSGAGKTAFLLCLLRSAAARGRRVVYATYELSPESLALRLLAKASGIDLAALPDPGGKQEDCSLSQADLRRAHGAREALAALPFDILPARGFSASSLGDRLVRLPFRAEVLAVDYLQGVVRSADLSDANLSGANLGGAGASSMGATLRELSDMASHLHVAVICAVRAADTAGGGLEHPELDEAMLEDVRAGERPDRIGWLRTEADNAPGARTAEVLRNRHGTAASVPLRLDDATGAFERA